MHATERKQQKFKIEELICTKLRLLYSNVF